MGRDQATNPSEKGSMTSQEQGIGTSLCRTVNSDEFIALVLSSTGKPSGKYSGEAKISGCGGRLPGFEACVVVGKSLVLCTSIFSYLLGASFPSSDLEPVCYPCDHPL